MTGSDRTAGNDPSVPSADAAQRYLNAGRILLLPLAILSVIVLARDGFRIPLNLYFERVLDIYDDMFRTIAVLIFEPAIRTVLAAVGQWLEIKLILLPHWKYVFVLWWLVFGAIARAVQVRRPLRMGAWYAWGGLCALLGGVVAGLTPLSSSGFLLCSSALFFYLCGVFVYTALQESLTLRTGGWAIASALVITIGVSSFSGIFYDPRGGSFGLKVLLTTIAVFAAGIMISAIGPARHRAASTGSFWREYLGDRELTVALDVLAVLAGAATITCVAYLAG